MGKFRTYLNRGGHDPALPYPAPDGLSYSWLSGTELELQWSSPDNPSEQAQVQWIFDGLHWGTFPTGGLAGAVDPSTGGSYRARFLGPTGLAVSEWSPVFDVPSA